MAVSHLLNGRERVCHLTTKECQAAIPLVIDWWSRHPAHNRDSALVDLTPLALSLHEISEISYAIETREAQQRAVAQGLAPDSDRDDIVRVFRGGPQVPWNAVTDGRLKGFILKRCGLIAQPDLDIIGSADQGFRLHGLHNTRQLGLDGLRRAREAALGMPRVRGQQMHALVFLDRAALEAVGRSCQSRAAHLCFLSDLEHAIAVSIQRIDRLHRFRSGAAWRDDGPSEDASAELEQLQAYCRATLTASSTRLETGAPDDETGLACVVACLGATDPPKLEIKFFSRFPGSEDNGLQRLESVLNYSFAKTWMMNRSSSRRTSVLQFAWIEKALAQTGDCKVERELLGEALKTAKAAEANPSLPGQNSVIAVVRTAVGKKETGRETLNLVLDELSVVLDVWAKHRARAKGKRARKEQSIALSTGPDKARTPLNPHEVNVWRSARPAENEAPISKTGAEQNNRVTSTPKEASTSEA